MDSRTNRQGSGSLPRIRVLSLGNCGVGKSCLIKRYCEQRFVQRYLPTIGIDYGSTTVEVDGRRVSVHFFDTSGSPLFEEVRSEFYPDMQGVMLVYDVTDRASFISLNAWMAELRHNLGPSGTSKLVLVVAGTRSDTGGSASGRQVAESEARAWASRHAGHHVLTSAALGTGVTQAFTALFSAALQSKEGFSPSAGPAPTSYSSNNSKTGGNGSTPGYTSSSGSKTSASTSRTNTAGKGGGSNSSQGAGAKASTNTKPATATPGNKPATNDDKPATSEQAEAPSVDPEAAKAIHRLLHSSDHFHKMQLNPRTFSKEEVNKSYRRLAGLVHPDKCKAAGAEEAFKRLAQARQAVLELLTETTV